MIIFSGRKNTKTEFTRMCIAEAIIELLQDTEIDKIRISSVIQKAGVSRRTFYNHYASIYDALADYIEIIVALYIEETEHTENIGSYLEYEHILHALHFFDGYQKYFVTLARHNLHFILLNAINGFVEEYLTDYLKKPVYEIYFYVGGLLNVFLDWELHKDAERAEDIALMISRLYNY